MYNEHAVFVGFGMMICSVCVCACVRACVRACVFVCVCVCLEIATALLVVFFGILVCLVRP